MNKILWSQKAFQYIIWVYYFPPFIVKFTPKINIQIQACVWYVYAYVYERYLSLKRDVERRNIHTNMIPIFFLQEILVKHFVEFKQH